ncbi:hypothetical protein [Ktedonobacter sp. SOSP1-52]|uniref:hypothetical protein n=1 Tax=Ktedonobacter sp. SOSP1-52 TaxID=2778366 RepID=UPI0019169ADF|nr:hypothetical protein [Ktedonobacter sp. SOSP1-52]
MQSGPDSPIRTLDEARTIITRIGEALAYAHERKIVHGNLTAHSVLFNANNEALLTDFTIISLRANVSPEMPTGQVSDINSEQGDLRALVSMFATLLSSGQSSAASSNGRPISSLGNWLPQTRITLTASVPLPIQAAINRVLDAESQPGFASVKDFLAAIQMPMSTDEDAKTESPQSTAPGKITGILPDVSAEVSRSVSQGLQEDVETQRPAFPSRPTTSTPTPLSRTRTPDQSAHMTRPLSSDRPLASNRQISRMLESQPPLQAKKAFPGTASTCTPVTPLPIPSLGANSEPEANHAQATQKLQSSDAQAAKLAPSAQSEPRARPRLQAIVGVSLSWEPLSSFLPVFAW